MFYLKNNQAGKSGLSPMMGRIRIGKTLSLFSLKIDADPSMWDCKAGRMMGKTKSAQEVNRAINRTNLVIHTRYKELSEIQTFVNSNDLKNVSQGISSTQATV